MIRYALVFLFSLFIANSLHSQTFVSPQQEVTFGGFADRIEVLGAQKIELKGSTFKITLPDGGELSGTMERIRDIELENEKRTMYELGQGGTLTVVDVEDETNDHIFVNLLGTSHNKTITYWLVKANRGDD